MPEERLVRSFYRRASAALERESDRVAFEAQLDHAKILERDNGHDDFEFIGAVPEITVQNPEGTIDACYIDADGAEVNAIIHLVGPRIAWAERYRNRGDSIVHWPPAEDVPLRFPRS